ncbi:glycoside hydrolase domain-containing protein [Virgisporangium aliadipatigenens]|uniref:glycoside hydrolase domain-containing protein n=1 Tax=Virgisporangium aliadipatigenens TaxID=741659 RepID=UPI001940EA3E|nr:glycoside hydrolase domain-containing protein [Virgisporangium aliadipatigenens]
MTRSRFGLAFVAVLLAGLVPALVTPWTTAPAHASFGISQHKGWDACGIGSTANAQAFWSNTPFWNMGLYIGGSQYGKGCTRWTPADVATLRGQGWKFLPLWVGPQAPCTSFASRFSADPATAYAQGRDEARAAYQVIVSYGWDTRDAPIIYDLEAFNTADAGCLAATQQFISGWVYQMHVPTAQKAGVYGSACASGLNTFASLANVPDFIDAADWSGNPSTGTIRCIPSGNWSGSRRHKQYAGDHTETWNGVTLNIDSDCSNGPVYPAPDELGNEQGCL